MRSAQSWLQVFLGVLLAAASGLLLTLSFAPYGWWPLVLIGFVPAIVAQHRVMPRRLSGLAYGVGLGSFYWGYFGPLFAGQRSIMTWVPLIACAIATLASGANRTFHERTGYRWFVIEGAVGWVAVEAIRAVVPFIGTSGIVAAALAPQPWLLQPVGVFGSFGLGLVIMVVNYGVALGLLVLIDRGSAAQGRLAPRPVWLQAGPTLGLLSGWVALSLLWPLLAPASAGTVRVAALQPNLDPGLPATRTRLIAMTRDAAAQGAQLVVWPEGALATDPRGSGSAALVTLARETGVYVALGYAYRTPQGLLNAAIVLSPDGTWREPYGKDHPVVWLGESSVLRGRYPVQTTPFGRVGTIICYDLNFADTARRTARGGAQLIAVPSNDWPSLAPTQAANLVLRAVENRVTVVKADSRYDSAIIGPTGQVVAAQLDISGAQRMVLADVPLGMADAPAIRLGDWLGWLSIAGLGGFSVAGAMVGRRARRDVAAPSHSAGATGQSARV